jgi:hypothetical protein
MAIIGRGASGKSTLAVRLREITGLPVIELYKIFWQPDSSQHLAITGQQFKRDWSRKRDGSWTVIWGPTMLSRSGFVRRARFFFGLLAPPLRLPIAKCKRPFNP